MALCNIATDNFLSQLISFPTRGSKYILDLLFTNHPELFLTVDIMDNLHGTDHDAFQFTLAYDYSNTHLCKRLLYNYKKADFAYFSALLSRVPWHLAN